MILRYLDEGKVFAFQSWYFAYVLVIALVVICAFFVGVSKKKIVRVLFCLPTVIMFVLCLIVRKIDAAFADYIGNADYFFDIADTLDFRLYVFYTIKKAGTERWLAASWRYIAFSAMLSLVVFLLSLRNTKKMAINAAARAAVILVCLLLACAIDRNTALSAKMLFSPTEAVRETEQLRKQTFINNDTDGNEIWSRAHSSGMDTAFEQINLYVAVDEIPIYAEPTRRAERVGTIEAGGEISGIGMTSFSVPDQAGWRYMDRISVKPDKLEYAEKLSGYVKIEDVVRAYGSMPRNGYPGLIARQKLMEVDVISYSMGYAVSSSIMYAFEPFEIYLLLPLTALFGVIWLTMVICGHIGKRKTKLT